MEYIFGSTEEMLEEVLFVKIENGVLINRSIFKMESNEQGIVVGQKVKMLTNLTYPKLELI